MSQATNFGVPLSGPATPAKMAERMDESLGALLSAHSGASRPLYAVAGTIWLDTATAGQHRYYSFDGTNDHLLLSIDIATGVITYGPGLVAYGSEQALSELEKTQARANIGALSYDAQTLSAAQQAQARTNIGAVSGWEARVGIGGYYKVDTSKPGVEIPPSGTSGPTVWVELTAGLTGAGKFNEGKLTGESVTGSFPLVTATATISLAGSPLNGQVWNLINTERRFFRAGASGALENDQLQEHTHGIGISDANFSSGTVTRERVQSNNERQSTPSGTTGRFGNETRPKNIGVTFYMRIK